MSRIGMWGGALALLVGFESLALALPGVVAVMPLEQRDAGVDEASMDALNEAIRTVSAVTLQPLGFTVLSGETTISILEENGIDLTKACEASCEMDVAREIKAALFIGGSLSTIEGRKVAVVRVFETSGGQLLGFVTLEATGVRDLRKAVEQQAGKLFARLLGEHGRVKVTLESRPDGASVEVGGRRVCETTPCTVQLPAGLEDVVIRKARHAAFRQRAFFADGTRIAVELTEGVGLLSVETLPPGVPISLDGVPFGKTPIVEAEVEPGEHRLEATGECFRGSHSFRIARGAREATHLALEPLKGRLQLEARDPSGSVRDAMVLVDGRVVAARTGALDAPICGKELSVELADGRRWEGPLVWKDRVATVQVEFGEPLEVSRHLAVRVGSSVSAGGLLGGGVEYRLQNVTLALGTGSHAASGAVGWNFGGGRSGAWVELSGVWGRQGPLSAALERYFLPGYAVALTGGYDWRPVRFLSVKAGLGLAYNTASFRRSVLDFVAWDLAVGPVF